MAKYRKALIGFGIVLGGAVALVAAMFIAGALFLLFIRTNPLHVTLGTWVDYWSWYHTIAGVKKRLILSMAIGLAVSFGGPTLAYVKLTEVRKTLFGEARFATDAEIRKAGLM